MNGVIALGGRRAGDRAEPPGFMKRWCLGSNRQESGGAFRRSGMKVPARSCHRSMAKGLLDKADGCPIIKGVTAVAMS